MNTVFREALVEAFRYLDYMGIVARPAFADTREDAQTRLETAIFAAYPDAMGSWAAWLAPDDAAFATTGELRRPLVLQCSHHDVVPSVLAACIHYGIVGKAAGSHADPAVVIDPASQLPD